MGTKFKYNEGDYLGPNKNIKMIQRLPVEGKKYYALFECPFDKKIFKAQISQVNNGNIKSCGCLAKKSKQAYNDLTNLVVGKLTVLKLNHIKNHKYYWLCQCECGNTTIVRGDRLVSKKTQSCGCLQKEKASQNSRKDLTNQRFGNLVALYPIETKRASNGGIYWKCKCDCGNSIEVLSSSLLSHHTISCGCISSLGEQQIARILQELHISFLKEYTFKDCLDASQSTNLRFDFYLPDYNCCIEYDGVQHFKYTNKGWNTKEHYLKTIQNDTRKDNYCKKHLIRLIRIPYTDFDKLNKDYILNLLRDKRSGR